MPATQLRPKHTPFGDLDLQENDTLHFLGDGSLEVVRGGKSISKYFSDYKPEPPKLQKKADATQGNAVTGKQDKADDSKKSSDIPPGARWITVHPGGEGSEGVPILIQPHPDGSASVIGGAGGKINHLKLNKLRSPEEWKQRSQERAQKRKEREAKRREDLGEEGRAAEDEQKQKLKEYHQTKKHSNALETLKHLSEYGVEHGLTQEHIDALEVPPAPDADPEEAKRWRELTNEAVKVAQSVQDAYTKKLVDDHEARAAARLGDEALGDAGNNLRENNEHTATDLDGNEVSAMVKLPDGRWLVRSQDENQADEVYEDWNQAAKRHAGNVLQHDEENGVTTQASDFYNSKTWLRDERDELPEGFQFDANAAAGMAALAEQRRDIDRANKNATKAIEKGSAFDAGGFEVGAVSLDAPDQSALDALDDRAKTLEDAFINHEFNSLVNMLDPDGIKKHANFGGYAQLAEISSEVLKQNVMDNAVVGAIGYNNSAKLLAYHLASNLSPREYEAVQAAQHAYHARESTRIAQEAVEQASPLVDKMRGLHDRMLQLQSEVGEGEFTPQQQIEMDNLSYEAETLHKSLQKQLGTTLGQLQASAAVSAALMGNPRTMEFNMKGNDLDSLIPQNWLKSAEDGGTTVPDQETKPSIFDAYGLTPDDIDVVDGADGAIARVKESGLRKLAEGMYSPEDAEAYEKAIAIKRGDEDEEFYLPQGFAKRSESSFGTTPEQAKNHFDTSLNVSADMADDELLESVKDYLGARVANGDNPLDVRSDIFSPSLYFQHGIPNDVADRVRAAVDEMDKSLISGRKVSDSDVIKAYQQLGDAAAIKHRKARKTDDVETLHKQSISNREAAVEAAHRTLAAMPMVRSALKPIGDLSAKERKFMREWAIKEILGEEVEQPVRKEKGSASAEPEEVMYDLFGNAVSVADIAAEQNDVTPELSQWQRFSKLMGGDKAAYEAVRDKLKGQFMARFASAYGAVSGEAIASGEQKLAHVEKLLIAQLPEDKRQEMLDFIRSRDQSDMARVRSRSGGKFARELDPEWLQKFQDIKGDNRQISLLTADEGRTEDIDWQRSTIGENAERELEGVLKDVLPNFDQVDNAVATFPVNWGGPFVAHQRGLKFLQHQKKIGAHFSAGAGKSAFMLGSFAQLHSEGKVKKSIVAVPSAIIGQFIGEAATFLEPGKYKYNGNIGWDREQRIQALKDDTHCHVTTRESLSNDLLHIVEKHTGITPDQFQQEESADENGNVTGLNDEKRRELMHSALLKEGIDPKSLMLSVDEAHDISRRKGVQASKRSLALDALAYHTPYYIHATGTPLKNDLSEMFDFLRKVDPHNFSDQAKFMAKYGQDTEASQRSLQRIMARYAYAVKIKPELKGKDAQGKTTYSELNMRHEKPRVQLSEHQAGERSRILKDYETVQNWYSAESQKVRDNLAQQGINRPLAGSDFSHAWDNAEVRDAVSRLASDETWGQMSDEEKRAAIGGQCMAAPAVRNTAMNRLYHRTPYEHNSKAQHLVKMAKENVAKGKPGVVFSASSQAAEMLVEEMKKEGIRVGYVHGGLGADQKSKERIAFSSPNEADIKYDVLICTDAAQTGLNLQRGKFLVHYDVPLTQKAWDQRSARIFRRGQTEDCEVTTLMNDSPEEEIALARMERKGQASSVFQGHSATMGHSEVIDDSGLAGEIARQRAMRSQFSQSQNSAA